MKVNIVLHWSAGASEGYIVKIFALSVVPRLNELVKINDDVGYHMVSGVYHDLQTGVVEIGLDAHNSIAVAVFAEDLGWEMKDFAQEDKMKFLAQVNERRRVASIASKG